MDTTVVKGMKVLEFLARAPGPVRLSALAQQLELRKSNVHRLLSTLSSLGYVQQEAETGRYAPTLKLWELGTAIIAEHPAKRAAMPFLRELHNSTSETVILTILAGDDVLYLDKLVALRPLRVMTRPGTRLPAALTAAGRAMLAHEADAKAIVERNVAGSKKTQGVTVDALMADIERAREAGYALTRSIWNKNLVVIAAPVMGREDRAVAALAVASPAERIDKTTASVIEAVLQASASMAESLGRG